MTKSSKESTEKNEFEILTSLFKKSDIYWRIMDAADDRSVGRPVPYIDSRTVQNRLDEAVGPGRWSSSFSEIIANNRLLAVRCTIGIFIEGQWVYKEDAAHLDTTSSLERAIKGAYSDAFKRAAVHWGIGRYLYNYKAVAVPLNDGRLITIPDLPADFVIEGDTSVSPTSVHPIKSIDENIPESNSEVSSTAPVESSANTEESLAEPSGSTPDASKLAKDENSIASQTSEEVASPEAHVAEASIPANDRVHAFAIESGRSEWLEAGGSKEVSNAAELSESSLLANEVNPEGKDIKELILETSTGDQLYLNKLYTRLSTSENPAWEEITGYVKGTTFAQKVSSKAVKISLYMIDEFKKSH